MRCTGGDTEAERRLLSGSSNLIASSHSPYGVAQGTQLVTQRFAKRLMRTTSRD